MIVDVPGIPLRRANGTVEYALVDSDDFVWLNDFHWSLTGLGYVKRHIGNGPGKTTIYMHRLLMGMATGDKLQVDHRNGDKLDNRRSNLRIVTSAQNAQNRRLGLIGSSSRFRGVSWREDMQKWLARATVNGRLHYLGAFDTEEQAALVASEFRGRLMPFAVEGGGE